LQWMKLRPPSPRSDRTAAQNFLHDGDTTATEQVIARAVILDQLLDRALAESDYHKKRAHLPARIRPIRSSAHRIAAFYHGSGFTGSGERYLNSLAGLDVTPEGKVAYWWRAQSSARHEYDTRPDCGGGDRIGYDDVAMAPADTGSFQ